MTTAIDWIFNRSPNWVWLVIGVLDVIGLLIATEGMRL